VTTRGHYLSDGHGKRTVLFYEDIPDQMLLVGAARFVRGKGLAHRR